jgi:hypothetical protein
VPLGLVPNGGALWSTNGITEETIADNGITQITKASDAGNPVATAGKRFMHLRIMRLP